MWCSQMKHGRSSVRLLADCSLRCSRTGFGRGLLFAILLTSLISLWPSAWAGGNGFAGCAEHLPYGVPTVTVTIASSPVCHKGYAALHDDIYLEPRWVAYHLTGPHTFGCIARGNNFHADEQLSAAHRATPKDYTGSGYDKGHQAPAQDFAWNETRLSDSFSMANMSPQLPRLNRQGWERLEEAVRAWAWARTELLAIVGPIFGQQPKTIGHGVAVPTAFFKIIIDMERGEALAFIMPQQPIAKGNLAPWLVSISAVEAAAGITFPLPPHIDRESAGPIWPADLTGWKRKHRAACSVS